MSELERLKEQKQRILGDISPLENDVAEWMRHYSARGEILDAAEREITNLREQLAETRRERDGLFEGCKVMVEGVLEFARHPKVRALGEELGLPDLSILDLIEKQMADLETIIREQDANPADSTEER